ncbi:MAG TPA: rhodanese-like domain-containing protein [Saprospiraceae bacterium]|nr:rhodanese-like domain-containing protein [Saprospiraceae bacterium]HPN68089.1 rhodanese-like domain-containing protein [Saprospiraceae bacterium]
MTQVKQINWKTLVNWIDEKKSITILDIRPQNERDEWYIPESQYHNAYEKLKTGDFDALNDFEFDQRTPIITICAKGRLSLFAAEILANKGAEVYSLEGGMNAWNSAYDTQEIDFDHCKIIQVRRIAKGCLSYVIGSGTEALVVDSSLDPLIYKEIADKENWTIKFVTDTHIHADYVSRTLELTNETSAKHFFHSNAKVSYPFTAIHENEIIKLGNVNIRVLFTPGHTFESTSYIIDDKAILTGDTLFIDGVGRPDLKAENDQVFLKSKLLYESLQKIMKLEGEILVMPAHTSKPIFIGEAFINEKLEHLKEKIPSLKLEESAFIETLISKLPQTPPNYLTIAEINKTGNYEGYSLTELEAGANRCGVS